VKFISLDGAQPELVLGRDALVPIRRTVAPALRRFAVARALRRDLIAGGLEAALELSTRMRRGQGQHPDVLGAAAVVAGCLDASDHLNDGDGARVVEVALRFPRAQVRKLGLARLETVGMGDEDRRRARLDPDAGICELAGTDVTTLPFSPEVTPRSSWAANRSGQKRLS
jgi:hypothetical protein